MIKIKPESIGFDFDGVIADIGEAFIRLACQDHGYCSITLEDISSFQVENCLNIPRYVVEKIFDTILKDSLGTNLRPLPGAIKTLSRLSCLGEVTIITARADIQPVIDWFDRYCLNDTNRHRIWVIATGDHDNKEHYIRGCGLSHFIDDRTITCLQLAQAGLSPIVYSQPWNRDQHDLPSVSDWNEVASLFDFPDS